MKKPIPERIDLTEEEANKLIERINGSNLSQEDAKIITGVLYFCLWLQVKLTEAKITIRKLSKFFGIRSEKRNKNRSNKAPPNPSEPPSLTHANEAKNASETDPDLKEEPIEENKKKGKNNGRLPASCYSEAFKIEVKHPSLAHGDPCPLPLCTGRVYKVRPGNIIRIVGGKMAEAKHYLIEKLRCNLCGTLFSAMLPKEMGSEKYDYRFKATLSVHKYYLGLPFYRMERMQSYLGVPLPDSTQWQLVEQTANSAYSSFNFFEYLAAQGRILFIDDTTSKILSVSSKNKTDINQSRTGTFTTAMISQIGEHRIYLFYSGRKHAGENATHLLKKRSVNCHQYSSIPLPG